MYHLFDKVFNWDIKLSSCLSSSGYHHLLCRDMNEMIYAVLVKFKRVDLEVYIKNLSTPFVYMLLIWGMWISYLWIVIVQLQGWFVRSPFSQRNLRCLLSGMNSLTRSFLYRQYVLAYSRWGCPSKLGHAAHRLLIYLLRWQSGCADYSISDIRIAQDSEWLRNVNKSRLSINKFC